MGRPSRVEIREACGTVPPASQGRGRGQIPLSAAARACYAARHGRAEPAAPRDRRPQRLGAAAHADPAALARGASDSRSRCSSPASASASTSRTAPCALVIGASVAFNLVAMTVAAENRRLSEREAVLTLLFDLCQLGALLYLTGGLGNPFALLIMAPVTISASVLTLRATILLAGGGGADHHPPRPLLRAARARVGRGARAPRGADARRLGGAPHRHRVPRDLRAAGHRRDLLDVAGARRDADGARARAAALRARRRGRGGRARARHAARDDQARRDRARRGARRPAAPAGGRHAGPRAGRPLHRDPAGDGAARQGGRAGPPRPVLERRRGGGGAARRPRHPDHHPRRRRPARGRARGAAARRPPAGDHPGPAQPRAERRRLRPLDGVDRPRLERSRAPGRDRRRRAAAIRRT